MWLTGLAAPRHVGSSQTRPQTRVPCIGRQILNHCATREALPFFTYGNNLEGWLASALWWPHNSKCSVIFVHRFTYSQNTRNNRIHQCWSFLPELFERRALPEALTLIHHRALPICPTYVKHEHPFRQMKSSITATHTQSPAFEGTSPSRQYC